MTRRPHPAPGPRAGGGRPWPPPGRQEKTGQQPRPNDVRPDRPTAPPPLPPTPEGKKK